MKREYVNPQTTAADTMSITMLCASGGAPAYANPNAGGGDPQNAI